MQLPNDEAQLVLSKAGLQLLSPGQFPPRAAALRQLRHCLADCRAVEFAFNGGLPSGAARVAFGTRREKQRSGVRVCSHIGKPFKAANAEERHCSVAVPSSGLRSAARCSTCCSAPASFFRWERTARGIGARERRNRSTATFGCRPLEPRAGVGLRRVVARVKPPLSTRMTRSWFTISARADPYSRQPLSCLSCGERATPCRARRAAAADGLGG